MRLYFSISNIMEKSDVIFTKISGKDKLSRMLISYLNLFIRTFNTD